MLAITAGPQNGSGGRCRFSVIAIATSKPGEREVRAPRGEWVRALVAEAIGFAAELEGAEPGGEMVEGVFVFVAEFGGAFVEAGLGGFFRFEEG